MWWRYSLWRNLPTMIKINLPLVGRQDVAQVKKLGGKWDSDAKIWYVIDPADSVSLLKWIDPKVHYKFKSLERLDKQSKKTRK